MQPPSSYPLDPSLAPTSTVPALARRVAITCAMLVYFWAGSHGIATLSARLPPHTLGTPADAAIPFVPWSVFIYSWAYTLALYPLFVVRCDRLFRRVAVAFFAALTVAYACFLAFPVTAMGLRPDVATLDTSTFDGWGMRVTYALDPPLNLFPSMHVALAILSAAAAAKASPRLGRWAWPVVLGIMVTVYTTKQHFLVDGLAGVLLAAVVWRLVLSPYDSDSVPEAERSYGHRGALAYVAFHATFYASFYAAYRMGVTAW